MKKLFIFITLGIVTISGMVFAWVGSDIEVGINYPKDNDIVEIPFTVRGWCWNKEQDIDYYTIELIEDTNTDTELIEHQTTMVIQVPTGAGTAQYELIPGLVPDPIPSANAGGWYYRPGTIGDGWQGEGIPIGTLVGGSYNIGFDSSLYVCRPFMDGEYCFIPGVYSGDCVIYKGGVNTGITPQDYANRRTIHIQNNFNQPDKTNLNLTPRYHITSGLVQPNKKYYMFIYAVDMDGNFSADTNIIGLTYQGDSTRTESMLRYFTTKGYRP